MYTHETHGILPRKKSKLYCTRLFEDFWPFANYNADSQVFGVCERRVGVRRIATRLNTALTFQPTSGRAPTQSARAQAAPKIRVGS